MEMTINSEKSHMRYT